MITINFSITHKARWALVASITLVVLGGLFLFAQPSQALTLNYSNILAEGLARILLTLLSFLGSLLIVLIDLVLQVAQFNNFIQATAVQQGWIVVRDLCNLLLVMVLLAIAWGTVLHIDNYHYRRLLPKFILMAILINFSKSISGFFIDIVQVIMKTFVDAFKGIAAANLTTGAGLEQVFQFSQTVGDMQIGFWDTIGAFILGLVLMALMTGAVLMTLIILLGRIIVLWILVVLSPVAYVGETIAIGKKAATLWWKQFGDYLVVGPVLAFFLWLAMAVMSANPGRIGVEITNGVPGSSSVVEPTEGRGQLAASISEISRSDNLLSFFLAVGLLFSANMAAQQIKTIGGNLGVKVSKGASSRIMKAPLGVGSWASRQMKAGNFVGIGKGIELNPMNTYRSIRQGMKAQKESEIKRGNEYAEVNLAGGKPWSPLTGLSAPSFYGQFADGLLANKGFGKVFNPTFKSRNTEKKLQEAQAQLEAKKSDEKVQLQKALKVWDPEKEAPVDFQKRVSEIMADNSNLTSEEASNLARQQLREEYGATQAGQALALQSDNYKKAQADRIKAEQPVQQLQDAKARMSKFTEHHAQRARNAAVDEEMKHVRTSNPEQLAALWRQSAGDSTKREAIARQAANTGNLPSLVKSEKASQNYFEHSKLGLVSEDQLRRMTKQQRDETERGLRKDAKGAFVPVIKEGTNLPQNGLGLQAFVEQSFYKKGKGVQTALSIESDLNDLAKTKDNFAFMHTVGVQPNGTHFHRTWEDHQKRVLEERNRKAGENYRKGNSSGMFISQLKDPKNPAAGEQEVMTTVGIADLRNNWKILYNALKKKQAKPDFMAKIIQPQYEPIFEEIRKTISDPVEAKDFEEMKKLLKDYRQPQDASTQLNIAKNITARNNNPNP